MRWIRTEKRTEKKEKTVVILSKWIYYPFMLGGYASFAIGITLGLPRWLEILLAVWFATAVIMGFAGVEAEGTMTGHDRTNE